MALDYPGNFSTPAFPAGQRIAVSRFMGIGILGIFLVIICVCGFLVWGVRSMRLDPFLISVDRVTGAWNVIGRSPTYRRTASIYDTTQEAVAGNFFQSWFYISGDSAENDNVWRQCAIAECSGAETLGYSGRRCAISCGAGDKLYDSFIKTVMPTYHLRAGAGETWMVITDTMQITPIGNIDPQAGGVWRIHASVSSSINGDFRVVAFVRVARAIGRYPMTLGYYVSDFNAYRMN